MAHWKKRETVFSEYGCIIHLEGHWQLRPGEDGSRWSFRSADRREQVTISRMEAIGSGDREAQAHRLVGRSRRALELSLGRLPEFFISEPEYNVEEPAKPWEAEDYDWSDYSWEDEAALDVSRPVARFHGSVGEGEHFFYAALFVNGDEGWQIFYEAFKVPEAVAQERFDSLLASVSFP